MRFWCQFTLYLSKTIFSWPSGRIKYLEAHLNNQTKFRIMYCRTGQGNFFSSGKSWYWILTWDHRTHLRPFQMRLMSSRSRLNTSNSSSSNTFDLVLKTEGSSFFANLQGNITGWVCNNEVDLNWTINPRHFSWTLPGHCPVQFVKRRRQFIFQDVVNDKFSIVSILLQTCQYKSISQVRKQVSDMGQQRL